MNKEIKPNYCPFCKSEEQGVYDEYEPLSDTVIGKYVCCECCEMQGPIGFSEYTAILLWNMLPREVEQ